MNAIDEEMKNAPRCTCDCHTHPGSYRCEPCGVCGHYHSQGQWVGNVIYGHWIGHRYELTEQELTDE